ncbi:hypothetical protein HU200_029044 [Digitaria exilis]|uniref:F-box domain-containing protein n=1 Tax=Digitaria exilis TaxID=1010633 RepID=A0A835BZE5_9POAL|nr:hypothetical protein HU200_029044 [Digitaria exilis]
MSIDAIPDAILELILLRIDSHFCLLDASSTCKRWRRLVADTGFLRQFSSLHGPPCSTWFDITFEPSSAAIPCDLFSLSFLQSIHVAPPDWRIRDSRGTLLLLDRDDGTFYDPVPRDMVRYKRVAPPFTSIFAGYDSLTGHLVDGEAGGGIGLSNFRVVCLLRGPAGHYNNSHYDAGVFTASGSNQQQQPWSLYSMGRSKGFEYWYSGGRKHSRVLVLRPHETTKKECRGKVCLGVTTRRDGVDRIVAFSEDGGSMTVFARVHGGGCEWAAEKSIALSLPWSETSFSWAGYAYIDHIDTARAAAALIVVTKVNLRYRVDIETNEVKVERRLEERAHACELPWPPNLRACTQLLNG